MSELKKHRIKCDFGITESLGNVVLWIFLSIITFGLAMLVFPYFAKKAVLNKSKIVSADSSVIGRLRCDYNVASSIGHNILWGLLIIVTFGLAAFIYGYYISKVIFNNTYIEYYD